MNTFAASNFASLFNVQSAQAHLWPRLQTDWAFLPSELMESLSAIYNTLITRGPEQMGETSWRKELREELRPKMQIDGEGVATIPIHGALALNPSVFEQAFMGIEDTGAVAEEITRAGNYPQVSAVLLDIDSPGGFWLGSLSLAESIRAAAAKKPVVAYVGGMGASLAYLAASQTSAVVASPGASVGSIGVIAKLTDVSGAFEKNGIKVHVLRNTEAIFKNAGTMTGEAVTQAQLDHVQASVNRMAGLFAEYVRAVRPQVPASSMQGQLFVASDAKAAGLVDFIGGRDVAQMVVRRELRSRTASAASPLA